MWKWKFNHMFSRGKNDSPYKRDISIAVGPMPACRALPLTLFWGDDRALVADRAAGTHDLAGSLCLRLGSSSARP
jgi:hypothetical protein